MTKYLLDTNIVLRLSNPSDQQHSLVTDAVANLLENLDLVDRFPLAEEILQIFPTWLSLVTKNQIKGKRTHDARIVAIMLTYDISHILTLNPNDFSGISGITVVDPRKIVESASNL